MDNNGYLASHNGYLAPKDHKSLIYRVRVRVRVRVFVRVRVRSTVKPLTALLLVSFVVVS